MGEEFKHKWDVIGYETEEYTKFRKVPSYSRLSVPGGWIYSDGLTQCFVPTPTYGFAIPPDQLKNFQSMIPAEDETPKFFNAPCPACHEGLKFESLDDPHATKCFNCNATLWVFPDHFVREVRPAK